MIRYCLSGTCHAYSGTTDSRRRCLSFRICNREKEQLPTFQCRVIMRVGHKRHSSPVDHWHDAFVSLDHVTYLAVQVQTWVEKRRTRPQRTPALCVLPKRHVSRRYICSGAMHPHLRWVNAVDTTISVMRSDDRKMKPRGLINFRSMDPCPSVR